MGARPLRRVIQSKIEDRLSDALLAGEFGEGDTIVVDVNEDQDITLRKEDSPSGEPEKTLEASV